MGGKLGDISSSDLQRLTEKAKEKLKSAVSNGARHVFISFAYENIDDVNLLRGQAKNQNSTLEFDDYSVKEPFDSENADYIRRQIREKIQRASACFVLLSEDSAGSKWVNWEIEEAHKQGKKIIGIFKGESKPATLPAPFVTHNFKCVRWSHDEIMKALDAGEED